MTGLSLQGLSPKGTVPLPNRQRGYLLVTVIITLFLVASIAVLLAHDSANSANTSSKELETARAEYVTKAGMQHALWRTQNNACMGNVTIPNTALGADSYDATITGASAGTFHTLLADQDAWIRSDDVTKNNGTPATNHIKQDAGNVEQVLTRFDLTAIPVNAQVNSAVAWFHLKAGKVHPEGPIHVHEITADWVETAVTWESFAGSFRAEHIAMLPAQDAGDVWVAINLTGLVQAWVNGQPNFGILFDTQAEGIHTEYTSREDGSNPPRLEVVVGGGPASPVAIQAIGTLKNGNARVLDRPLNTAYQPSTITVLQPGTEGKDGGVRSPSTDNFGVAIEVTVSGGVDPEHFLVQFPVERIPRGSRIVAARVELYLNWLSSTDPAAEFSIHRMTEPWTEGSGDNWNPGDGANWNTSDGSQNWDWQSNHDASTAMDTTIVDPSFSGWHSWEIADLLQQWTSGHQPNYGVVIKGNANALDAWFRSSDYSDSAFHPRLVVEYACECGTACMSQTGSGNILMVVAEKTGPSPVDQAIKTMLEDWGYTIELISDNDNQNTFDGGIVRNDVVYVAESVDSTMLVSKVSAVPIGVVNGDGWMNDELGFESDNSSNWPVGSDITITDSSHYISAPLAAGSLSIYDADMGGLAIGNTPAPGLQPLANWGGDTGLAVLESGAPMANGGSAAGRRVMLPFGRDNSMDWSRLNNSGQLILQRAISWGMGVSKIYAGRLLLVVADAANPVTGETDRKSLIESWGYEVTLISDHASQGEFDTALAGVDVAYITGSGSSADVDTKLTAATIGVLSEDMGLVDELGIAQPAFLKRNSQSIDIFDNTHYVTDGFSLGTLQLYSYVPEIWTVTGLYAPGLQVLAGTESSGSSFPPGLSLLDAGAELWGGGLAAGRRVQLPWAQGSFDINALNDDGKTIMRRAIEWGAGACTSTKPLLLVVGDAANLSSKDSGWRSQLEKWCYQVSVIDDGADQATFDIEAAANGVIYVSGTINDSTLGNKITTSTTPIVNEDRYLLSEFGFSENEGYSVGHTILTTDNPHYINEPFAGSNVVVFANYTIMDSLNGTKSEDLMGPAQVGGSVTVLGALEVGARTWNGNPVTARRVHLPFENAEIGQLTTEGLVMLRRSIDWAAGADPYQGPIAHWKLDETSGSTAVDSIGGHHGTLVNMDPSTDWVTGTISGGLNFDGSNDYINVWHDNTLSLTIFSMSAWIYPTALSGWQAILVKTTTPNVSNYYFGTYGDEVGFGFYNSGWVDFATTTANLTTNQWYHVAATFDDANGEGKIYLDGVLSNVGTTTKSPLFNSDPVTIGKTETAGENWQGSLDDVRIYDRVLDGTEITDLATPSSGQPLAHWKLDETSGTTAVDSAGGHDGTTANTTWVAGHADGGLQFNSSSDSVTVPHSSELNLTDALTLTAWINKSQFSGYDAAVTKATSGSDLNFLLGTWENNPVFGFSTSSDNWQGYYATPTSLATNTWYHLAATFDNSADEVRIYVDGSLVQSFTSTLTPLTNAGSIRLGRSAIGEYWPGILDDVRIYDAALSAQDILNLAGGGGGGGGGGGSPPVFEEYTEANRSSNGTSLSIPKPGGAVAGDLLIAALATDGDSGTSYNPPSGWTQVSAGNNASGRVGLGVWWKIATDSEPSQYTFSWSGSEQAYGWVMRFTNHDSVSPVYYDNGTLTNDNTSAPTCQRLTTPVDNMLVLRIGGFDDDDITVGNPGLDGHTAINMGKSGTGNASTSGGSGYLIQETAGDSDLAWFQLTRNEQMRTVTLGIRPAE